MSEEMLENTEDKSALCLSVQMTDKILYDYLIHHAYTHFPGIMSVCFAVLGLLFYARTSEIIYLALAVLLIFYLPVNLGYRAKVQMMSPVFKEPIDYEVSEAGIRMRQNEAESLATWDMIEKAVSTKKSIVMYTGKNSATIFPREALGDDLTAFLSIAAAGMKPGRMKVRF